ncbi:MAG: hypothetical protein J6S63_04660 [Atopobiaceae bacterium]|nr:hypothetical protein [Atopobiaceae bacterium]
MTTVREHIDRLLVRSKKRTRAIVVFACLALVVGLLAERGMRQQGITLTGGSDVLDCKSSYDVAHTHNADCYDAWGNLACPLQERELHTHDDTCYGADGTIVCGKQELTQEHVHGPGCFRAASKPATPKVTQYFDHDFKDANGNLLLYVEVSAPAGALPSNAFMEATWLEGPDVDMELVRDAVRERTDGTLLNYQAVNLAFFDEAGNQVLPTSKVLVKITSSLLNGGDKPVLVHVESDAETLARGESQGLSVAYPQADVVKTLSAQELDARGEALAADQLAADTSAVSTFVVATSSERQTLQTQANGATITVEAPASAGIPAGAWLEVNEVASGSKEYKDFHRQALDATGATKAALARYFDINIMTEAGKVEPADGVAVTIALDDAPAGTSNPQASVVHFIQTPEEAQALTEALKRDAAKQLEEQAAGEATAASEAMTVTEDEAEAGEKSAASVAGAASAADKGKAGSASASSADDAAGKASAVSKSSGAGGASASGGSKSQGDEVIELGEDSSGKASSTGAGAGASTGASTGKKSADKSTDKTTVKSSSKTKATSAKNAGIEVVDDGASATKVDDAKGDGAKEVGLEVVSDASDDASSTAAGSAADKAAATPPVDVQVNVGDIEIVPSSEKDGTTQFLARSFSVYGVLYTVDFEYQGFKYTLPGGGAMTLSELFSALKINEDVANVEEVTFTNPDLLSVERVGAEGASFERLDHSLLTPDPDTKATGGKLKTKALEDGEDFDELPTLIQTVQVAEGDWIITSLESFDTPETLVVKTAKSTYTIAVTDPPTPFGPGAGFFGGTATWDMSGLQGPTGSLEIKLTNPSNDGYEVGDKLSFEITYLIESKVWTAFPNNYNPWLGYPTFTYDFGSDFKNSKFLTSIKSHKSYLYFGGKKRGTLEVDSEGKIKIQVTDMNWFNSRDEIGGSFTVEVELTGIKDGGGGNTNVEFPGTPGPVTIEKKKHVTTEQKTITNAVKNDGGSYTLTYSASFTVDESVTSLKFEDTLGGKQTLGTVTVDNSDVMSSVTKTEGGGFTKSFTYDFSGNGLNAGTHAVTYTTTVDASVYESLSSGGSDWTTTNTCKWTYDSDKEVPGGDTTYEIKKEPKTPPTVDKTSSINDTNSNGQLDPGEEITYTLTITGKELAGMGISDSMTDLQVVQGTPSITVNPAGNSEAYGNWINAITSQITNSADANYSPYSTTVIGNSEATKIPNVEPFNSSSTDVTITITYTTRVIDQSAAAAAGVYGQQNITNTLSEDWTWQNHTTSHPVKYEDETVTKVSKSATHTMQDHGTYEGATLNVTQNGIPDGDGIITYIIVVGDGTTTLDGVRVTDTFSGDQQLILESFQMTGSNVTVGNWKPYSANENPTMWNQQAFDFSFPAGTGTGPVTIKYETKPFSGEAANGAGIYGERTFSNTVRTSTDEDTVGVNYEYPYKVPFVVKKTSAPASGTTIQSDSPVTYTIIYGSASDAIAGLTIMDEMTDLQKLKKKDGTTGEYKASTVIVSFPANDLMEQNLYGTIGYGTKLEMTKTQDGKYTFDMPDASSGWGNDGVTWSHFDDDSYNENMVRVFNFAFPSKFYSDESMTQEVAEGAIKGRVTVTYTTTIINEGEAAAAGITGQKDVLNTATAKDGSSTTTVKPDFPKNLNHNPDVSKSFSGWDDDG